MNTYTFKVEIFLRAQGETPEEAWHDYLENIDIYEVINQINCERLPPIAQELS